MTTDEGRSFSYMCKDGTVLGATYYDGTVASSTPGMPPTPTGHITLTIGRNTTELKQTISADGARYTNADESVIFWDKGQMAMYLENNKPVHGDCAQQVPEGKLKVVNFSGTLEQVNEGCYVDGECYVVVDKKHVTVVRGWSQETVGSVLGVDNFGELNDHIGKSVEVYAQDKGDGTYTLYGSAGFYVKALK